MQRIVVGFDGSDASVAALRWAVAEAGLHDAKVAAWTVFGRHDRVPPAYARLERWVVKDPAALAAMVESEAGRSVSYEWIEGCAGEELVGLSWEVGLLVLGAQSHCTVTGVLPGTVTQACLQGAFSPVAIVRNTQHTDWLERPVVVGIDGTPAAPVALAAGAEEARLRGTSLHVVHAVHGDLNGYSLLTPTRDDVLGWGQRLVSTVVGRAGLAVPVRTFVLAGRPADVLIRHSRDCCLLVLGSRPGGRRSTRFHPISAQCAAGASCPTLVTRS